MYEIKRNIAMCRRCGDVIESKHVHDFVRCKCGMIFTDGGQEYIRRGGYVLEDIVNISNESFIAEWDKQNGRQTD